MNGASGQVTYGPDGEEAPLVYGPDTDQMSGKVLPGRAKTGTYGFAVPAQYLDDVVLEFSWDYDHAVAVFAGPVT